MNLNLNPDDFIQILTEQRNAALNEIVRMGAIIKAQERQLREPAPPPTPPESPDIA